jgi:tripartite-type tricarboxylate transporter receptor subunit TctC
MRVFARIFVSILLLIPAAALAQTYPNRTIRIVVPLAAGGTNDIIARLIAEKLTETLKASVIVENRPGGAGGTVGADTVAKADPDGYTLLLASTATLAINPSLYAKLPYDPQRDFEPISVIGTSPLILVVNTSLPAKDVGELITLLRAKPGDYSYASAGKGTPLHLVAELFATQTGTQIVHVPYRGAAPAVTDLLAGHVHLIFDNLPSVLPHIQSGTLRPLLVTGSRRLPQIPDTPTVVEAGLSGAEAVSWFALAAPKGTPPEIVGKLSNAVRAIAKSPAVSERLVGLGTEPWGSTPDEMKAHVVSETAKWARIVKEAGVTAE